MFSLKSKLILGFSALLAVAVIVGAIGSSVVNSYGQALTRILRENYDSIVYCEGMKNALSDFRDEVQDVSVLGQHLDSASLDKASQEFGRQLDLERGNITLSGEKDSVEAVTRLWKALQLDALQLTGNSLSDTICIARYHEQFRPLSERLQQTIQNISDMNLSNMIAVDGLAQRRAQEAKQITYILILVGILLALILILVTGRAVLQPLKVLTQSIREIQSGNLNLVLQPRFRDEVGQLMEAFNDMAAELRVLKLGDQAKLARSQQSAQLVLDSLPDAVIVMSPDATVELANAAARRMIGVRPGGSIYDTSPEWHRSLHAEASSNATEDKEAERVVQVFVEGKEKFFMPRVLPIKDVEGLPVGIIIVFLDVTRLRRVSELENDLVSTVSRRLKTPLTSVRMALHMLFDERVGQMNEKQTELLTAARDDAERLFGIVSDLLDVARYKSGKSALELKPVSAHKLIEKAIAASRTAFQHAGVELKLETSEDLPDVLANESRIAHVFTNLLSNALKFSRPGTDIALSVQETGKYLEISVADQGPGIPKDECRACLIAFIAEKMRFQLLEPVSGWPLRAKSLKLTAELFEFKAKQAKARFSVSHCVLPPNNLKETCLEKNIGSNYFV
ncbi:MAG: HAMP domain-containing protein [bacterium]|nr:HAMP domain-containing protein [bacterium]